MVRFAKAVKVNGSWESQLAATVTGIIDTLYHVWRPFNCMCWLGIVYILPSHVFISDIY